MPNRGSSRKSVKVEGVVSIDEINVPKLKSVSEVNSPFWVIDPDKAKVPEDNLDQWQSRLQEIEKGALQLALAAQLLQGKLESPEQAYEKFQLLKKAWNKVTYQTRCVTEGVSINEEYFAE